MDWLDEILNDYERKKAEKRKSAAEEQKRQDEESTRKRRLATEALGRAHNKFQEVKKKLVDHKYPCEVILVPPTANKAEQELTLLVKNDPLWGKETISKLNASSVVLKVNLESNGISVITKYEQNQGEAPVITDIKIDLLTDDLIDTIIKKFINQIFGN